jgi:diadenylate cyclase
MAAGCFLPLTQNTTLDKELGTRHRAAIGETEQYDSHLAIIVSEETGVISVARRGEIVRYYDSVMLNEVLEQVYGLKGTLKSDRK